MDIITQLGINKTVYIQFFIYLISFVILYSLVFKGYFAAAVERELRTKGGEELAQDVALKSTELYAEYEKQARAINSDIKAIYDEYKEVASKETQEIIGEAKNEAQLKTEQMRKKITAELKDATEAAKLEVPKLAQEITNKMLKKV